MVVLTASRTAHVLTLLCELEDGSNSHEAWVDICLREQGLDMVRRAELMALEWVVGQWCR